MHAASCCAQLAARAPAPSLYLQPRLMCLRLDGSNRWQSSGIALVNVATVNGAPAATCALSNLDSQAVLVVQYTENNDGGVGTSPPPTTNVTATVTQLAFTVRLPTYSLANFTVAAQAQYVAALKAATNGEESRAHLCSPSCFPSPLSLWLAAFPTPLPPPSRPQ